MTIEKMVSFAISLIIIGILMMVFGSVRIGLIGLIPNVTPAVVVGGLMGWMGLSGDYSSLVPHHRDTNRSDKCCDLCQLRLLYHF